MPWFVRIAVLLSVCALAPLDGAQHRFRVHPNTSITILSLAEGPDGLLWIAALDGLYRFDGFHFQRMRGFPFASARSVASTRDGSLWIGSDEGLVRFRNDYKVLLRERVAGFAASADRVFVNTGTDHRVFDLDGSMHSLNYGNRDHFMIDSSGGTWISNPATGRAVYVNPDRPDVTLEQAVLGSFWQVARDADGRLWAADANRAVEATEGREGRTLTRRATHKVARPFPLVAGRNRQLWFVGETIQGLSPPIEFRDRSLNDQYPPTAAHEDSRGHLWVARHGQGLVEWIPDTTWQRWPWDDTARGSPAQIVRERTGSLVAGGRNNLYRLDSGRAGWTPIAREPRDYAAMLPLSGGGFLASIRKFGLARLDAEGKVVERPSNPLPTADEYRELLQDGTGTLWVGNKRALLRVERRRGLLTLHREELPGIAPKTDAHAVDLELDAAGRLWVGDAEGLSWRDGEGRWHRVPTDQPVRSVRSFTFGRSGNEEDIWVGYRFSGKFSRLRREGDRWKESSFDSSAGYEPADTHFIKRDSRGWIWRGATDGVHISDGIHVEPADWLHLSVKNGLAADSTGQYGFFEDPDGTVWITGEEGISALRPNASWFASTDGSPPRITRISVDGQENPEWLKAGVQLLPASSGLIRVEVGSLHAPPFRDHPIRYRLAPLFEEWRLSRDGSLEFKALRQQAYTLEVSFAGSGSSAVQTFSFRLGSSPFWSWFAPMPFGPIPFATGALVLLGSYFAYSERMRYKTQKFVFMIRRRFSPAKSSSPDQGGAATHDCSGETFIGRYEVVRIASRGGFSTVYEARDSRDGSRLAIKVLAMPAGSEGWLRDRFAHEVAALRSIEHPAMVQILDSWINPGGEPCLAMPFLTGPTLREALTEGAFAPGRAARILRELGSALAALHSKGIVHRDLKPENIMFSNERDGQPMLIDFGTAGLLGRQEQLTTTTLLAGSFHYMAPERLSGYYSAATDVYSLGVIALEMITGKRLADFRVSPAEDAFAAEFERVLQAAVGPAASPALARQLLRAYDSKPQKRPPEVEAWSREVSSLLDGT